jgi:hypothetical protein
MLKSSSGEGDMQEREICLKQYRHATQKHCDGRHHTSTSSLSRLSHTRCKDPRAAFPSSCHAPPLSVAQRNFFDLYPFPTPTEALRD